MTITFCPLCNSAISFDRVVDGRELTFGTTGNLRHSDLVMWDRQTESWWQQITGEAIVGEFAGTRLELLPSAIVAWGTFAEQFPDGSVLDKGGRRRGLLQGCSSGRQRFPRVREFRRRRGQSPPACPSRLP